MKIKEAQRELRTYLEDKVRVQGIGISWDTNNTVCLVVNVYEDISQKDLHFIPDSYEGYKTIVRLVKESYLGFAKTPILKKESKW